MNTPNDGGTGGGAQFDPNAPEVQAFLKEALAKETQGLAKNRDELLNEKKQLAEQLGTFQKQWEGLDPQQVRQIMERLGQDEEMKLLAEGKTDEVIERRTQRLRTDYETKVGNLTKQVEGFNTERTQYQERIKGLMLDSSLRQAAAEMGLVPSAFEDALYRARSVFKLGEGEKLIAEENGATIYGKNGRDPITPQEWLESMKEKAPHWFPAPSGGGAGGGSGRRGGGAFTISREEARDPQKYQAAKAAAAAAGQQLQITQ